MGVVLLVLLTVVLAGTLTYALSMETGEQTAEDVVSGDVGDGEDLQDDLVVAENATSGADGVVHSAVVDVDAAAGTELDSVTVSYPKAAVDLGTSQHDDVLAVGVDTDGDGDLEESFDEDDVSGVNTNDDDSELTVGLDTAYTLASGDRVTVRYDDAKNPDVAGDYDVSVTVNGEQTTDGTLTIG